MENIKKINEKLDKLGVGKSKQEQFTNWFYNKFYETNNNLITNYVNELYEKEYVKDDEGVQPYLLDVNVLKRIIEEKVQRYI